MKKLVGGYIKPYYHYSYKKGVQARRAGSALYVVAVVMCALASVAVGFWQNQKPATAAAKSSTIIQPALAQTTSQPLLSSVSLPISQSAKLQDVLTQFAQSHPANAWSVSLQGLGALSNVASSYSPNTSFSSASIFKLLLIYPLTQKVPLASWATTNLRVDGHSRSLEECVDAMLRVSDNDCAVAVGNFVGWRYGNSQLRKIGLSQTNLNNPAGPTTTAADAATYMQMLASGQLVDPATSQFVLADLSNQIYRAGIPAGCGDCTVADKTGDLGSVRHDVALVNYRGGSYVLAIFTSGASYSQIAQLTSQIQAVMAGD